MKRTITLLLAVASNKFLLAQLIISTLGTPATIDFTDFDGSGFSATPSAGQLSSNTWAVHGFSDGNIDFGEESATGDFARGLTPGSVTEGGIYAADIFGNQRLMVQPLTSDFTPGSFTLKIKNETGSEISFLNIAYTVYALNDQHRSGSFNFSYSADNIIYTDMPLLNFSSPAEADMLVYTSTPSASISGILIADGGYFYLRWTGDDDGGIDSRDEFMLDDISVTGYESGTVAVYAVSPPSVNVDESAGIASFSLSLSESADCVLNLNYTELTADLSSDFSFGSYILTFTEGGPSTQTVEVDITDDLIAESDENFIVYFTVAGGICAAGPFDDIEIGIEDNDVVEIPVVNFAEVATSADEAAASVAGAVSISASGDCDVEISLDAASTLSDASDYFFTLPAILAFTEGGPVTQYFDVLINDDTETEPDEMLILNLTALSGCTIGPTSSYTITITDNDTVVIPEMNIADIHNEDTDGICTGIGDIVSVTGIVYGVNLADDGLQFTLIDETAGIGVFNADKNFGYTVTEGDKIRIIGAIDQVKGLTEIIADTLILISSGNTLHSPALVLALDESTESQFVYLSNGLLLMEDISQWSGDGTSFNVDLTNGMVMYIDNNTELSSIPASAFEGQFSFTLTGLGTQDDALSPFSEGYKISPRYWSDFQFANAIHSPQSAEITFYPNPAIGNLYISGREIIETIEIFDQVAGHYKTIPVNACKKTIDIHELPAGFYIAKIKTSSAAGAINFIKQ